MQAVEAAHPADQGLGRPGRFGRWWPLAVPVVAVIAVIGIYLFAVQTASGRRLDEAAVSHYSFERTPAAENRLHSAALNAATLVLAPAVLWWGRRPAARLARIVVGVVASVAIAELVRLVLPRPPTPVPDALYGASFPSGHAAAAMALTLALVVVGPDSGYTRLAATAVPATVGVLALGYPIHRPSDLVAGFLVALAIMIAAVGDATRTSPTADHGRAARWLGSVGRVGAVTAVLLSLENFLLRPAHLTLGDLGRSFPPAVAGVVALAELTVAAFSARSPSARIGATPPASGGGP